MRPFVPRQYDQILKTNDIQGARPKEYSNEPYTHLEHNSTLDPKARFPQHSEHYSYQHPGDRLEYNVNRKKQFPPMKGQIDTSDTFNTIKNSQLLMKNDRALYTQDIEGAQVGSYDPRVVKINKNSKSAAQLKQPKENYYSYNKFVPRVQNDNVFDIKREFKYDIQRGEYKEQPNRTYKYNTDIYNQKYNTEVSENENPNMQQQDQQNTLYNEQQEIIEKQRQEIERKQMELNQLEDKVNSSNFSNPQQQLADYNQKIEDIKRRQYELKLTEEQLLQEKRDNLERSFMDQKQYLTEKNDEIQRLENQLIQDQKQKLNNFNSEKLRLYEQQELIKQKELQLLNEQQQKTKNFNNQRQFLYNKQQEIKKLEEQLLLEQQQTKVFDQKLILSKKYEDLKRIQDQIEMEEQMGIQERQQRVQFQIPEQQYNDNHINTDTNNMRNNLANSGNQVVKQVYFPVDNNYRKRHYHKGAYDVTTFEDKNRDFQKNNFNTWGQKDHQLVYQKNPKCYLY